MTKHVVEQLAITDAIAIAAEPKTDAPPDSRKITPQGTSIAVSAKTSPPRYEDEPTDNFFGPDSDCLVVGEQAAVAVYETRRGDIAIRQEKSWDEDDDRVIFVNPANLEKLIQALQAYVPE